MGATTGCAQASCPVPYVMSHGTGQELITNAVVRGERDYLIESIAIIAFSRISSEMGALPASAAAASWPSADAT